MKKLISLVLSLVLCLSAVSAFAQSSPTNVEPAAKPAAATGDVVEVETIYWDEAVISLTEEEEALKAAVELVVAGALLLDPNALLGENPAIVIPENFGTVLGESIVHEFHVADNYKGKLDSAALIYSFQTKYNNGEKVYVLLAVLDEAADSFYVVEGLANEDGDVEVTFDKDLIEALDGKKYIPFPISEDGIVRE